MMTINPEPAGFTPGNEGETFNAKEANIASASQNFMDTTPAYPAGTNTQH